MVDDELKAMRHMTAEMQKWTLKSIESVPAKAKAVSVEVSDGCSVTSWFHPASKAGAPVLFEVHGGGFVLGDARKEDALCEWIRDSFDVNVVGVNYRLVPEYSFPTQLNDVVETARFYAQHADEYGIDPRNAYFMGYSAGAALSVGAAFELADDSTLAIRGLLLHYPFLDASRDPASAPSREIDLPIEMMRAFNAWYAADADPAQPLLSPVYATDEMLRGLPRTIMCPVEGDFLFRDATTFAEKLTRAGGEAVVNPVAGVYHGYIEDAANIRVYEETTMPETIEARPSGYAEAAGKVLASSLALLFGKSQPSVAFASEG